MKTYTKGSIKVRVRLKNTVKEEALKVTFLRPLTRSEAKEYLLDIAHEHVTEMTTVHTLDLKME